MSFSYHLKRQPPIEAWQHSLSDRTSNFPSWLFPAVLDCKIIPSKDGMLIVKVHDFEKQAGNNDWVLRYANGQLDVMGDVEFKLTYEPLPVNAESYIRG